MTTTQEDLLDVLKRARVQSPPGNFRFDQPLTDQGVHSMDMAVVLFEIENKFDVTIPTDIVASLRSLDDIARFLDGQGVTGR